MRLFEFQFKREMMSSFLRKIFHREEGQRAIIFASRYYRTTATSLDINVADASSSEHNVTM